MPRKMSKFKLDCFKCGRTTELYGKPEDFALIICYCGTQLLNNLTNDPPKGVS